MKNTKHLILVVVAVFLITATVFTTVAYLTSTEKVTNTFTVGDVQIDLEETDTNDGDSDPNTNKYHLVPNSTVEKDPTVTVLANSEDCYVRMMVTVNCYQELSTIKTQTGYTTSQILDLINWDRNIWNYRGIEYVDTNNDLIVDSAILEFRYKEVVTKNANPQKLAPLFTEIKVPGILTNAQIKTLQNLEVVVEAHAIQATGFANADYAWAGFDDQYGA